MSDVIFNLKLFGGFIAFVFAVSTIENIIIKRHLKRVDLKIPEPPARVSWAVSNGELVRPENEDWLYLCVKRPYYSFRVETFINEKMYVYYNGEIRGKFILKRLGFSGYMDGIRYRYIDDTLSKYEAGRVYLLDTDDEENSNEKSSKRSLGIFNAVRLIFSQRKKYSTVLAVEEVSVRGLGFLGKFSNAYIINKDTDILRVICQNYRSIYHKLYPSQA